MTTLLGPQAFRDKFHIRDIPLNRLSKWPSLIPPTENRKRLLISNYNITCMNIALNVQTFQDMAI